MFIKVLNNQKLKILNIRDNLSSLFNDLDSTIVYDDEKNIDDIMQRVEHMKLQIEEIIEEYKIAEDVK